MIDVQGKLVLMSHFTIIFMERWIMNFHYRLLPCKEKLISQRSFFWTCQMIISFEKLPKNTYFFPFYFAPHFFQVYLYSIAFHDGRKNEYSLFGDDARSLWLFFFIYNKMKDLSRRASQNIFRINRGFRCSSWLKNAMKLNNRWRKHTHTNETMM